MSSQSAPAQRHHSRTSRHFTDEQIRFVLDRARAYQPTRAILVAFNDHFAGVRHIELGSVKYIRSTYANDPQYGPPMGAPMGTPLDLDLPTPSQHQLRESSQRAFGSGGEASNSSNNVELPTLEHPNVNTFYDASHGSNNAQLPTLECSNVDTFYDASHGSNNLQEPTLEDSNANMAYDSYNTVFGQSWNPSEAPNNDNTQPSPEANQQSVYPSPPLHDPGNFTSYGEQSFYPSAAIHDPNSYATYEHQFDPSLSLNPFEENLNLGPSESWHEGAHHDCELDSHHRHDWYGGVFFPSMEALKHMAVRAGVVQVEEYVAKPVPTLEEITAVLDPQLSNYTGSPDENETERGRDGEDMQQDHTVPPPDDSL